MRQERVDGLDLARAIAIFGMFVMHSFYHQDPDNWFYRLFQGRSTILFTVLAGVSVILMSRTRAVGASLAQFVVRGLLLVALGLTITTAHTGPIVILTTYGALYLLVAPLLFRAPGWLQAVLAATGALLFPWLSMLWRTHLQPVEGAVPTWPMLIDDPSGTLELLIVTGGFPVLTFAPVFVAGMATGNALVKWRTAWDGLIGIGGVLAAAGLWLSSVFLSRSGFVDKQAARGVELEEFTALLRSATGVTPVDDAGWLWVYVPHSGSVAELIGSIGAALLVIGVCVLVCLWRPFNILVYPLRAVGRMPLSVYTAHIVFLGWLSSRDMNLAWVEWSWVNLLVPLVFAPVWLLFFKRGPLEIVQRQVLRTTDPAPRP
ncbi:DUF418 domain-containing protein [Corynebacterium cystitidis]|uniref:DUF418 domain-containing protein n=1 Tax=Corynebacterium cystitidis TaxID=35757 RepID=UPI00211E24BA|nr:DUF418 domain-containing protein [Corynebacterium cystitidis]